MRYYVFYFAAATGVLASVLLAMRCIRRGLNGDDALMLERARTVGLAERIP